MKELFESSYLSVMSNENMKLREELQRKDNIINELKKWLDIKEEKETVGTFSDVLDKIKELEESK